MALDTPTSNGSAQNVQVPATSAEAPLLTLDEVISIDDLQKRKYKLEDLVTELQLMKNKISTLRYEMISLMRLMATINDTENQKSAQENYTDLQSKVTILKEEIDTYIERYKKIQPLVLFAKKELGKQDKPLYPIKKPSIKMDAPMFQSNQALLQQTHIQDNSITTQTSTSARTGRGGAKRGTTARKPRGRGGSTASQRQNSRGGAKSGSTPSNTGDYSGNNPSEPILL